MRSRADEFKEQSGGFHDDLGFLLKRREENLVLRDYPFLEAHVPHVP